MIPSYHATEQLPFLKQQQKRDEYIDKEKKNLPSSLQMQQRLISPPGVMMVALPSVDC